MSGDPLFDTFFRGSAVPEAIASAAPIPTIGTHSRAGNAMGRTRGALLIGAARAVVAAGTKITMSQVAASAGVAKATLYNHFRTREAVLSALLEHEVGALVEGIGSAPLERALTEAATQLSEHPLLRSLASREPATLAAIARVDLHAEGWRTAHAAVQDALERAGFGGAGAVLRWLASYLVTPGDAASIADDVRIMLAGLPVRSGTDATAEATVALTGTGIGTGIASAGPLSA